MPETIALLTVMVAFAALAIAVWTIARERRAKRLSELAQSRLIAIMEAAGFGVLIVDSDGRLSYANNVASEILGYPVPQLVGRSHAPFVAGEDASPLVRALATDERFAGDVEFVDAQGQPVPVLVSTAPLPGTRGGNAILFRDRSVEVAEEARRRDALSLISHELRSPLTSVVGFSNRLERAVRTGRLEVDEIRAEEIALLAQEARRMRDIVTVVLDVSNLERQIRADPEPLLLRRIVDEEAERLARELPGATFIRTGEDDAVVESDERYVRRIVQNLLENAVKYAGTSRPVEVSIVRREDAAAGAASPVAGYAISVRDEGPGIPVEAQARIFERFYREAASKDGRGGLGLGLFLAERLTARLGGRLTVQSRPGEGATFTLWLPSEATEAPAEERASPADRLIW